MKKKLICCVAVLFLLLTGCAKAEIYNENPLPLEADAVAYYDELGITDDVRKHAEAVYQTFTLRGEKEVQVRLPEYWEDIYVLFNDGSIIGVSEKYNYEKIETGGLWTIDAMTYEEFAEYEKHYEKPYEEILGANTAVIGCDDEYVYMMSCPTDVQFEYTEEKATALYQAAWDTREQFISDFLTVNNITPNEKAPVLN